MCDVETQVNVMCLVVDLVSNLNHIISQKHALKKKI